LQGFPHRAQQMAERALRRAQLAEHAISQCHALAQAACPVALWRGDLAGADTFHSESDRVGDAQCTGGLDRPRQVFFGVLLIRRGEMADGVTVLQSGIQDLRAGGSTAEYPAFRAVLAHGLALSGRTDEALATSDEAIDRSEATEELRCAADHLRVKAESGA
jgi:hypothetical protein